MSGPEVPASRSRALDVGPLGTCVRDDGRGSGPTLAVWMWTGGVKGVAASVLIGLSSARC